MPTPQQVIAAVSEVVAEVEDITSTIEGQQALKAAVEYGVAEGHQE